MKLKRLWLLLMISLAFAMVLVACGPAGEEEKITLRVIGEDYSPMQGLAKVTPRFTEETGIEVEITRFDAETLRNRYLSEFQAGASTYDVVMGAFYDLGLIAVNDWALDFDQVLADPKLRDPKLDMEDFSPAILDLTSRYQGHLIGLPCSAQSMFLWYRKDLFQSSEEQGQFKVQYGYDLPQPTAEASMTFDQYRDVAAFFTRDAGAKAAGAVLDKPLYGTTLQLKNSRALWFEFQNYLYGLGGAWFNDDGAHAEADSPTSIDALRYYIGLKPFAPPGAVNYTWDEALTLFQSGQAAMGIMWSDSISAVEDPQTSLVAGKIGFAANPVRGPGATPASAFGGWGFFVNAKSENPGAAARFVQWANRPDIQLAWARAGGIPATLSTYRDPTYAELPGSAAHAASLHHLVTWSTAPYTPRLIDVGQNQLARTTAGELEPARTMEEIDQRFQAIVHEYAE